MNWKLKRQLKKMFRRTRREEVPERLSRNVDALFQQALKEQDRREQAQRWFRVPAYASAALGAAVVCLCIFYTVSLDRDRNTADRFATVPSPQQTELARTAHPVRQVTLNRFFLTEKASAELVIPGQDS